MKGTIIDLIPIMIITFVLLVGLVFGSILYNEFKGTDIWDPTYTGDIETTFSILDYGAVFIIIASGLATVVFAFFIRTHPIFFVVSLILMIIVVMVSGPVTNAFMGFAQDDDIADTANDFPMTLEFMGILPYTVLAFAVLIVIGLYVKPGGV